METQVRTPQMIFMQPQRLVVPLFQRPYVWNEENQWEPLWNDVIRSTERLLKQPHTRHQPHFLGAVVLQQVQNPIGLMQTRTIIDGQQRLTTLQLLLDALHAELISADASAPAARIEALVRNQEPFCSKPEDQFKVWPTNRDRPAFNAVMGAKPPVNYEQLGHRGERMVEAHRFFSEQARNWLNAEGTGGRVRRAVGLETVVRELLQMVVIDLGADENAQEIFETLNARGAQLTAADLIKNFVFQRLMEAGSDVEQEYLDYWKEFETAFWEAEVAVGRIRYPRISVFLNHWLIAQTGEEIVAREVFDRFKRYADHDSKASMTELLRRIHRASGVYRKFVTDAMAPAGPVDRLGLFSYRTGVLESEVIKPLLLCLLDPEMSAVPEAQLSKALNSVESWMVRRMLVRATTKSYNQAVAESVKIVRSSPREKVGDVIEQYIAAQTGDSRYWPDDAELRSDVSELLAYRRLRLGRLRMVLEGIEDYLRGWHGEKAGLGGERVARGKFAIEHVMPRKWLAHWTPDPVDSSELRDKLIHTLGNLTLLTGRLNSSVSNGPWIGVEGKRNALQTHDVLLLNRKLIETSGDGWSNQAIRARTRDLIEVIIRVWPVPEGHQSGFASDKPKRRRKLQLSDLLNAGVLHAGIQLTPRQARFSAKVGVLLPDGQIELDGRTFSRPSAAAMHLTGSQTNGWSFFYVDPKSKTSLRRVRSEYLESLGTDLEDDEEDDDDDE
jgi:hypothetical protein